MQGSVNINLDPVLCQICGGRCCQGSPGVWIDPERFFTIFFQGENLTLDQLRRRLADFDLVLWEKSGVPVPAPSSLDTGCFFHATSGCSFSSTERPCQCLALIPNSQTLKDEQGCHCSLPDEFCWDTARRNWQDYWLKVQELQESIEQPAR